MRYHGMMRQFARARGWILAAALGLLATTPAHAVITRLTPLKEVLSGQQYIFTAVVDKLDPARPAVILNVDANLKDKVPFTRMPVNMTGDTEAQKGKHSEILCKRLKPELPVIVFAGKRGKQYTAFVYSNGTWFQVLGQVGDSEDKVVWSLAHGEPYLRRTFKGTTAELKQIVVDGLAKKKEPPDPNPKEEPGFGPEASSDEKKEKTDEESLRLNGSGRGPLFAVIPSVFIMGPLALLAALFPAVFGGLAVFMKRWMALLSVACMNSTLISVHMLLAGYARGAWWGSTTTLWVAMTLVTLAGALWSAQRYRTVLSENHSEDPMPRRSERRVLGVLSLIGLVVTIFGGLSFGPLEWHAAGLLASPWKELLVFWVGVWAGVLYLLYLRWVPKRGYATPCELIVLWAMLFATANFATLEMAYATSSGSGTPLTVAASGTDAGTGAKLEQVVWTRTFDGGGTIVSSPLIDGDRVYVAVSHAAGFSTFGIVYCLERDSGSIVWQFDADKELMQVFSSPCLADGKLYFGEGLHTDKGSRLFCVDVGTGKEVWRFQTQSHTESSPCVGDGKVFFGAGDDGIYCCDATTGKQLWQYQPGLHVDASPTVLGKRVYAGSGVSRTHSTTSMFCLDADSGKELWRTPTELPVWGSPTVSGDHVFFGLGNGQFGQSADKPAGAVIGVEAATGKRLWERPVPDGVLDRPLVDDRHVYFGARDKLLYCVDRGDGRVVWKQEMGSPVVAGARLVHCSSCAAVTGIYAAASDGRVSCLDPNSGKSLWSFELARHTGLKPQLYATPAVVPLAGDGERHRIVIAAGLIDAASVSSARVFCLEDRGKP
jgi:outer membrane protein assembly factor BamB